MFVLELLRRIGHRVEQLLALRAQNGPYRFLVRKWDKITDIDLAERLLQTEFLKRELLPLPLPLNEFRSIFVIAPHQDDEIIGAGGTLLLAANAGVRIDILFVTDGDLPKAPSSVRYKEASEVCKRIGANMHKLGISNHTPQPQIKDLKKLASLINEMKPDVVMIPWILDWPPKHRLVNHLLYLTYQCFGLPNFEVWGYQVHNTLLPNGYVDITNVASEKRKLLECYHSQNEYYERYDHIAMGMAAWNARFIPQESEPPKPRYIEVFFTLPRNDHLDLINTLYFNNLEATYRGDKRVIEGAAVIHETAMTNSK